MKRNGVALHRYVMQLYWEARPLPLARDAEQLLQVLRAFGMHADALASWIADDGELVVNPFETSTETLHEHLRSHPESWKHGGTHYSASLTSFHNGRSEPAATQVSFRCGVSQPSTTVWFANYFLVTFRPSGADGLWPLERADELFATACSVLLPRWAALGPRGFPKRDLDEELAGCPLLASRLYLSPSIPSPRALAPPSTVETFENGARIIKVVPGWFDPGDESQLLAWQDARVTLAAFGSLRPMADSP